MLLEFILRSTIGTKNVNIDITAVTDESVYKVTKTEYRQEITNPCFTNNNMGYIFLLGKIDNGFYDIVVRNDPEFYAQLFCKFDVFSAGTSDNDCAG